MARKSIKGYAEKNYYDNTRFTGGVVATNDPLNEGSFKHLVNLDITDTGQSVTPRKGFLTTSMQGVVIRGTSFSVFSYVYKYDAANTNNNIMYYFNADGPQWYQEDADYILILDDKGFVIYFNNLKTSNNANVVQNGYKYNTTVYLHSSFSEHPLHSTVVNGMHSLILKENTTAYFLYKTSCAELIKYLEDTNYLCTVECKTAIPSTTYAGYIDFISSINEIGGVPLYNDTIYFYDESLGEYIFINFSNDNMVAYRVIFDIEDNFIKNTHLITNIDVSDIEDLVPDNCIIVPSHSNQAIRALDEYSTAGYIIKVDLKNTDNITVKSLWLRLFYRENASEFEGNSYEADTLVISYLNTSDVVNYVDTTQRNLASSESIIPDSMQEIYEIGQAPIGHYDRLPMIYMKQDGKYLINNVNTIDNIEIIPNFYLEEIDRNDYAWAYAYDIISTNRETNDDIYRSPIFYFDDSYTEVLTSIYDEYNNVLRLVTETFTVYDHKQLASINTIYVQGKEDVQARVYKEQYFSKFVDKIIPELSEPLSRHYILYIVPLLESGKQTCDIDITRTDLYGPLGLGTYFNIWIYTHTDDDDNITDADGAAAHNKFMKESGSIFCDEFCTYRDTPKNSPIASDIISLLDLLKDSDYGIYVDTYEGHSYGSHKTYNDCKSFKLDSPIYSWKDAPKQASEIIADSALYNKLQYSTVTLVYLDHITRVRVKGNAATARHYNDLFFDMPETTDTSVYYITTRMRSECTYSKSNVVSFDIVDHNLYTVYYYPPSERNGIAPFPLFTLYLCEGSGQSYYEPITSDYIRRITNISNIPLLDVMSRTYYTRFLPNNIDNIFQLTEDNILIGNINEGLYKLHNQNYFDQGLLINFYLLQVPTDINKIIQSRDFYTTSTSLKISRQLIKTHQPITTYVERLEEDPRTIAKANNSIIFESPLGDHLVLWVDNKVYISKENMQYYFTEEYKHEFSEPVVKVIAYKDMLLVFSTQHLYAVYLYEDTINVENGTNEDGTTKYVQQKVYQFAKLPVLYNLLVSERYKEVIQVYNQMVLFYSADGQLFLIKPTAAIDSNTRFSIQYFNKSANDILLNYKDYMQDRLYSYGLSDIIKDEDIIIKATANINYIKIFYCVPELMTYILIYDVINNRYTVYDTLSFTKINSLQYIPTGELYITEHDGQLYFTVDNNNMNDVDTNTDIAYYNNFSPFPINAEIDTGTINLNNHLKKRFKDLHVIYKNLNANTLEFSLDTYVDDVPIMTHIESNLEIRNISGYNTLVTLDTNKVTQLVNKLEEMLLKDELIKNNALFNFTDYTSNKIITHKTNIVSKGKTIRVKMNFTSKGRYKIQGYGLIYKEHTV